MNFFKVMLWTFFFSPGVMCHAQSVDLENIRINYKKAVLDKAICQSMIEKLSVSTESNVHMAYLGAFQTIWAKHVANPVSKLNTFNKGKSNIEKAVSAAPDHVEIRFIRLSVQKNSPSFLGYKDNMEDDKKFIQAHNKKISSSFLKKMIAEVI